MKSQFTLLVLCLVLNGALRWNFHEMPLERDVGSYAYIAWQMTEGKVLYQDLPDTKFPLTYLTYAAAFRLFSPTFETLRWLTLLWGLAGCGLFTWLAWRWLPRLPGAFAAFFFALASPLPAFQGFSSQMEAFMLPWLIAALLPVAGPKTSWWHWGFAGALSGVAFGYKQVAVGNLFFLLLWVLWKEKGGRERLASWVAVLAGFLLPIGGCAAYLLSIGALVDGWYWTVTFIRHYAAADAGSGLAAKLLSTLSHQVVRLPLLWVPAALGAWVAIRDRDRYGIFAWWAASLVGLTIPVKFYDHYYMQLIPALSLLAGTGIASLRPGLKQLWKKWGYVFIALLLATATFKSQVGPYLGGDTAAMSLRQSDTALFSEAQEVADKLGPELSPGETFYLWGSESALYFYTLRPCPSKYHFWAIFTWAIPDDSYREIVERQVRQPPAFIVRAMIFPSDQWIEPRPPELQWHRNLEVDFSRLKATDAKARHEVLEEGLKDLMRQRYEPAWNTTHFQVYRRKENP